MCTRTKRTWEAPRERRNLERASPNEGIAGEGTKRRKRPYFCSRTFFYNVTAVTALTEIVQEKHLELRLGQSKQSINISYYYYF